MSSEADSHTIGGRNGANYRFTLLADGLLRYEWAPDGVFEDRPSAFAATRNSSNPGESKVPDHRIKESDSLLEIITTRFHLTYNKQEFSPHGLFAIVANHTRSTWRYGKDEENEGGTARTLDGVDGRMEVGRGVVSQKGFATIDDSATMLFEEDGFIAPRRPGQGRVDGYLFAYGHEYREAVKALYTISGSPPFCHAGPLAIGGRVTTNIRQTLIDMDWHLVDDPRIVDAGMTGWTGYTWNKELFPDPPAFLGELHKRDLKVTLNDHPADGIHSYEDLYKEVAQAVGHDTSHNDPVPFEITDRKYLDAYMNIIIKSLEDDGTDFIWVDWQQGEFLLMGVDPLWVLNHYHFVHNAKMHKGRPIIFSRYAGPGSHSLDFQPEFTNTASNIGYGWWSHDIGGHMNGVKDYDLLTRWVQYGVFSPIMRLHSSKSLWVAKEAWKLPTVYREVVTAFMRLRHRMIPYLHTMNFRQAVQGEPLIQPMYWEYPYVDAAYKVPNQYYFGSQMIVAPITMPQNSSLGLGKVKAWLPPGRYVDYFSGVVYDGDRELWLSRPLEQYPVLLKEGSIVPLDQNEIPKNGGGSPNAFEVVIAVGADGYFELVEDNEDSTATSDSLTQDQEWSRTSINFTQSTGRIHVGSTKVKDRPRGWSFRFPGLKTIKGMSLRVMVISASLTEDYTRPFSGNTISVSDVPAESQVIVDLGPNPQLAINDPVSLIEPILNEAQNDYEVKDAVWDVVSATKVSALDKLGQLQTLDIDEDLRLAVTEYLIADSRS
ncbi:glycoside hydrolase [Apiospora phragmitis]|uniref:alpha-glucosidase n=1 Tax=Apiospora phragmitis TaxID=2905665 RepID=A0ABR1TVH2_9PEZI